MGIKDNLMQDIKLAMKAGDTTKRDALRVLHSALKQVEIDSREALSEEDYLGILKKALKQRQDAKDSCEAAGRAELAAKEAYEMELILAYLPKQLSDEELEAALRGLIEELGASGAKDLGRVLSKANASFGAVATGKRMAEIAKRLLA